MRSLPSSLSAVSEAPPSEELGVETLCRGASDTALRLLEPYNFRIARENEAARAADAAACIDTSVGTARLKNGWRRR
jgi:hypothetical protein